VPSEAEVRFAFLNAPLIRRRLTLGDLLVFGQGEQAAWQEAWAVSRRVESEEYQGNFNVELNNGDFINAEVSQAFEALASPFETSGVVVERVPAGAYLYLRLRDVAGTESWVVTLARAAPAVADVRVTVFARADTFSSKRLGRTFEPGWFGAVRAASTPTPPESP
jgi:hypothetical protein